MGPTEARTTEQVDFLCTVLPEPPARVLDVGCGSGRVAAGLRQRGFMVVGIDPNPEAVEATEQRGVTATVSELARFEGAHDFDAVVLARSLHHVADLPAGLDRVESLLAPGGTVVVDEFAHEKADAGTAALFYGLRDLLADVGMVTEDDLERLPDEPLRRWRDEHQHDPPLHEGENMVTELRRRFDLTAVQRGPYLWAYLSEALEESTRAGSATLKVKALEARLIKVGAIQPLGLRVVGHTAP